MASTIKVDNVQNQPGTNIINKCSVTTTVGAGAGETVNVCAATVNLGRSGGTVNLTSGATQSGFGRTGTVDWITTPKVTGDSPVTAVTGKGYFLNTTAGTITLNLPAGSAGDIVSLADYAGTWQTYNVTVAANGSEKIGGTAASAALSTEGQSVTFVYVDAVQGWVNTMDSTSNVRGNAFMVATVSGACNTLTTAPDCANVKIAKFVNPGTFCVSQVHPCAANNLVSYMVVGGGAGGGFTPGSWGGGGGGAGGFRELVSPVAPYTASPLNGYPSAPNRITVSATPYPIAVGGGGAAGATGTGPSGPGSAAAYGCGGQGVNSSFDTIVGAGGGYGGGGEPNGPTRGNSGGNGGSGGGNASPYYAGGCGSTAPAGTGNTPSTTPAQGFPGGQASGHVPSTSYARASGGGGGATVAGQSKTGPTPAGAGTGGTGATTEISSSPVAYAGGGGGGAASPCSTTGAAGGTGGGGAGAPTTPPNPATAGTVNTGGGGGGGAPANQNGATGGSGIVYIRYKFQ